jgi:cystathionine beta-lyase family protein involved in aluminum resistance
MNRDFTEFSPRSNEAARRAKQRVKPVWNRVDDLVLHNQKRVLDAFVAEKISVAHLSPSTGYGYGDAGRDALDRLYARVFASESAMVRMHWASGTHVLKSALFGLLRPGDELLCVTGAPYETLLPILEGLRELGVSCRETSCLLDYQEGRMDLAGLEQGLAQSVTVRTRLILVQRSRGYSARKSITMEALEAFMRLKTQRWPGVLTVADNCYCEFAQHREPPSVGVSITAGSLIKNPGGGICPTGGYVAGNRDCVRKVAEALYSPGLAGEVGSNPYGYRDMYQGLFLAPRTVGEALKGASFAAAFFEDLGFAVDPAPLDPRCDTVQAITTLSPERLKTLVRCVQAASPVDSFAEPEPWDMPGYRHQVIMAAGTFVQGSSIELSCDAPFTPPYTAYLQGGLSKEHVMLACMKAGDALI